ncbi:hypothetical protein DKM27_23045 [Mycobacterium tuberculosis variant bovis]|nr:hypothetical protein DKM27_23045 [Mycobacterium tuberculosis variant bovis]
MRDRLRPCGVRLRGKAQRGWIFERGCRPINDSAEVQRLVKSLGAQSEQLPKIGTDLENIAAALAEAQKAGTQRSTLLSMTCNTAIPIMWVGRQPPGTHTAPRWMRNTVSEGK